MSDCRFFLEGRWFLPRTPLVILVRESELGKPLPEDDRAWHVLVPNVVIPLAGEDTHLASVRCGSALDVDSAFGVMMVDLELWNALRLIATDTHPDGGISLTVPSIEELYPPPRDPSLHEALFAP